MAGTLFVVATPIGNLEDMTLRALRVLREVDVIAAEDTRHTGKLLAHFGISTPLTSFHEHNTKARLPQLLTRLRAGDSVALVSDAGTPVVSDPGLELIAACIGDSILVDPLPGPSAPLAAAIVSGFPLIPLTILGFAPTRAKERHAWLHSITALKGTITFFEAPHRVTTTLGDLANVLGSRPIAVARELTKLHQQVLRGTANDILGRLTAPKGEFTIVVGPGSEDAQADPELSDAEIMAEFGRTTEGGGLSRRNRIAAVARKLGKPTREIYAAVERAKKCGI